MKKYLSLILLSLLLIISCAKNDEANKKSSLAMESEKKGRELISQSDKILQDIKLRRAFSSSTMKEKQILTESISFIKNSLLQVINGTYDSSTFKILNTYVKKLESINMTFTDDIRLRDFKDELYSYIQRVAQLNNVELKNLSWLLYETNFSRLDPFTTFSTSGDWVSDWALNASFARVRGWGNKAWLISPVMDFSKVEDVTLRIHHQIMADADAKRGEIPFDRKKVLQTTFKIMVSTDYQGGEPDSATWIEVPLKGYPSSINFHATWSEEMVLPVAGKDNVSVALFYNMNERILGKHYVSWQVNKFQILGLAEQFSYQARKEQKPLYQDEFNRASLGRNKTLSMGEEYPWSDFAIKGQVEFAKIEASAPNINTWMFTPKIKMNGKDPILKIKEVARNLDKENFKLKISTNYNGGNPEESLWDEYQHVPLDYSAGVDQWKNFNSLEIDLSKYIGKEIVIAFQYLNVEGKHTAWEIDEIVIGGEGDELSVQDLNINFESPNKIPEVEGLDILYQFNFSSGMNSFKFQKTEDGAADFKLTTRNGSTYAEISGFKAKNNGEIKAISENIKLGSKSSFIKVKQAINHLKGKALEEGYIKILIAEADDLTKIEEIKFEKSPQGNNWDTVESEWFKLPDVFLNKSIVIIFSYKSNVTLDLYPSWNLFEFKLGEKNE